MSEPSTLPVPASASRPVRATRRRLLALVAATPGLLIGCVLVAAGDSLAATAWGFACLLTAATAALATLIALAARDLRREHGELAAHRAFADELCAAHGRLAARLDELGATAATHEATWRTLFQTAPHVGVLAMDTQGRITACNPGAARLLGVAPAAVPGRSLLEFHVENEIAMRHTSGRAVPDFAIWTAAVTGAPGPLTWTWRRSDGRTVRVALSLAPLTDATGATTGWLAVAEDVTAQELADARLHILQAATRALLDAPALADALPGILQAVGAVFQWERARLWTADNAAPAMRPSHEWRAPEAPADAPAWDATALVRDAAATREGRWLALPAPRAAFAVPLRLARGQQGVIEVSGRLHRDEAAGLCALFVTLAAGIGQFLERKDAERGMFEAQGKVDSAARAKSDFLALMSHEIRTPMNGVIGMSNLLLETPLTAKQRDFAQTIRSSGDSLLTVINDILDFSKIEAGKFSIEKIDFDLRSAVEETLELMAGNAYAKGLELAAHVHADVPHFVHGDPNRLRQVLNNLVANAIKFTAQGEVIVTVAREPATDRRTVLHFAVRDTGIGIPPDVQKRLFQPFMQADTSTTRRYGGTGLGLAIAKQIVSMMHGRIGVVSEEGKGATFHFTIRFDAPKDPALVAPPRTLAPAGARVLVVEDNASYAGILGHLLKAWGLRPIRATSSTAALNQLREAARTQEPFALALLDSELPDAAGTLLARTLRHEAGKQAPRIVLLAGPGRCFEDSELQAAGVMGWLTKPVRESRLHETLVAVLAGETAVHADRHSRTFPFVPIPEAPAPAAGGDRLLLVEDNVINQQVALQLLHRLGYQTDVAVNGVEALAALRRTSYRLVLMDCLMPHLDGFETTRRIREIERRRRALGISRAAVHIIALTANAGPEDRARCRAAGMDDFVSKPLRAEELERALEHWRRQTASPVETTAAAGR